MWAMVHLKTTESSDAKRFDDFSMIVLENQKKTSETFKNLDRIIGKFIISNDETIMEIKKSVNNL